MTDIILRFDRNGTGLKPVIERGYDHAYKTIDVDNAGDFTVSEGDRFVASLVRVEGRGVNARLTLHLEGRRDALPAPDIFTDFWVDAQMLRFLMLDLRLGHHILLRGPKGTGKTTLGHLVANRLGVPFLKVDCTGLYKPKDLAGAEHAEGGSLMFVPSAFVQFLESARGKEGCPTAIVLLDEITRSRGNAEGLHPLLDDTRRLAITTSQGTRVIEAPPGVVFMGSANPVGGGYMGTANMDAALLDRMEPYDLDYPPPAFEVELLMRRTNISPLDATSIVGAANALRKEAKAGKFPSGGGPSPRRTLHAAAFVVNGVSVAEAIHAKLLPVYPGDPQLDTTERGMATAILRATGIQDVRQMSANVRVGEAV